MNSLPVPPAVRAEFEAYLIESRTQVIQRVSKKSFVVVTSPSAEAPFGLLHIRTGPNNNIQCTCHKYKRATSLASATTAPKLSKRCTHFYLFLWATLSNESLMKEFSLSDNLVNKAAITQSGIQWVSYFFPLGTSSTSSTPADGSTSTFKVIPTATCTTTDNG